MAMNVSSNFRILPPQPEPATQSIPANGQFHQVLSSAINQVEVSRAAASQNVEKFLSGEGADLHSTILAVQRADLEFEMMLQLRNKVVSAYQEVMRMQM